MKREGKCVHYNGTVNKACEIGVVYDTVKVTTVNPYALPCMDKMNTGGVAMCECRQLPTAEEIEADRVKMRKGLEDIGKARAAIVAHLGGPWKRGTPGASGTIDCPACGKTACLRFSRAGYNGHVHANCTTPDCVSWME